MSLSRCPNAPATATFICSAPLFYIFPEEAYLLRYYLVLIYYRLYHSSALSTTEVIAALLIALFASIPETTIVLSIQNMLCVMMFFRAVIHGVLLYTDYRAVKFAGKERKGSAKEVLQA